MGSLHSPLSVLLVARLMKGDPQLVVAGGIRGAVFCEPLEDCDGIAHMPIANQNLARVKQ